MKFKFFIVLARECFRNRETTSEKTWFEFIADDIESVKKFLGDFWLFFFILDFFFFSAIHKKIVKHYHNQSIRVFMEICRFYGNIFAFHAFALFYYVVTGVGWKLKALEDNAEEFFDIRLVLQKMTSVVESDMLHYAHTWLRNEQFSILHDLREVCRLLLNIRIGQAFNEIYGSLCGMSDDISFLFNIKRALTDSCAFLKLLKIDQKFGSSVTESFFSFSPSN